MGGNLVKAATLYTRADCHLCDEAARLLAAHGLTPIEVDIDGDPELLAKFSSHVPVVEINGRVRFRGEVDPILLRRIVVAEFGDCAG